MDNAAASIASASASIASAATVTDITTVTNTNTTPTTGPWAEVGPVAIEDLLADFRPASAGLELQRPAETGPMLAVHDGMFHADDVLCVALWVLAHGDNCRWVRTRQADVIATADAVADVGEGRYDHHGIRAKEAGDAWLGVPHCGATLLAEGLGLSILPTLMRELLVVASDDNGRPRLAGAPRGAFGWVSAMVPSWNEATSLDEAFQAAVTLAVPILRRLVRQSLAEIAGQMVVYDLPTDTPVVELAHPGLPWRGRLIPAAALYVVYQAPGEGAWQVLAVPPAGDRPTEQKAPLPASWAGLRGEALEAASGIPGAVFCHANRFVAGWKTREAALKAAQLAVDMANG